MGGGYYDREMVYSHSTEEASKPMNSVVGKVNKLFHGLDPKNYVDEDKRISCPNSNPIVFALDVTGSMGEWPKVKT